MTIEQMLFAIIVLLVLLLFVLIWEVRSNIGWMNALEQIVDESNTKKRRSHEDIADLLDSGKYEETLAEVEKRLAKSPRFPALLYWYRGTAYYHQSDFDGALAAFETSIELEPRYKRDLEPYIEVIHSRQASDA